MSLGTIRRIFTCPWLDTSGSQAVKLVLAAPLTTRCQLRSWGRHKHASAGKKPALPARNISSAGVLAGHTPAVPSRTGTIPAPMSRPPLGSTPVRGAGGVPANPAVARSTAAQSRPPAPTASITRPPPLGSQSPARRADDAQPGLRVASASLPGRGGKSWSARLSAGSTPPPPGGASPAPGQAAILPCNASDIVRALAGGICCVFKCATGSTVPWPSSAVAVSRMNLRSRMLRGPLRVGAGGAPLRADPVTGGATARARGAGSAHATQSAVISAPLPPLPPPMPKPPRNRNEKGKKVLPLRT